MTQFRIIINDLVSEWQNASEWNVTDLMQFLEFKNLNYEFR